MVKPALAFSPIPESERFILRRYSFLWLPSSSWQQLPGRKEWSGKGPKRLQEGCQGSVSLGGYLEAENILLMAMGQHLPIDGVNSGNRQITSEDLFTLHNSIYIFYFIEDLPKNSNLIYPAWKGKEMPGLCKHMRDKISIIKEQIN